VQEPEEFVNERLNSAMIEHQIPSMVLVTIWQVYSIRLACCHYDIRLN
jgi:hypothetical protein